MLITSNDPLQKLGAMQITCSLLLPRTYNSCLGKTALLMSFLQTESVRCFITDSDKDRGRCITNNGAPTFNILCVFTWLSRSEYSNLSEIKLLIPEWVFSKGTSEGRVCAHCNRDSTNGSTVENVFLNELVSPRRYDECLCQSLQIFVFYRRIGECVHSLFVIIILERNTTSAK